MLLKCKEREWAQGPMQGDTPLGVTHIKKNNNKNINCEVNSKDMDGHSDVPIFRLGFISVLSS